MTTVSNSKNSDSDTFSWTPVVSVFLLSLSYALVRYWVYGPVTIEHIPTYITNKALAVFAVGLLILSAYNYVRERYCCSKKQGRLVWHAAVVHSGLSLALLHKDYFPAFFSNEGMSGNGELIVLFGVLACYALWQIPQHAGINQHRFKRLACALTLLHLVPMSTKWLEVSSWYASMPPMSLISAILTSAALLLYWRYRDKAE